MKEFYVIAWFISIVSAYRPVVLIHGILTGNESMEIIQKRIEEVLKKLYHQLLIITF